MRMCERESEKKQSEPRTHTLKTKQENYMISLEKINEKGTFAVPPRAGGGEGRSVRRAVAYTSATEYTFGHSLVAAMYMPPATMIRPSATVCP